MTTPSIKRALVSTYDKSGLVEFARVLTTDLGIEILSTGGTAKFLLQNDIPVTLVEQVTGASEMLDGRVKTLHPAIHAAILADRDNPDHMRQLREQGIEPIDMVVVNLYPFEQTVARPACTFSEAIEMIDIGGPCLLRAAAKNHRHVLPVPTPEAYEACLALLRGEVEALDAQLRQRLAAMCFDLTSDYDSHILAYLAQTIEETADEDSSPEEVAALFSEDDCGLFRAWGSSKRLRYGENPHQQAAYLRDETDDSPCVSPSAVLSGEALSFNNYVDAAAATALCGELAIAMESPEPDAAASSGSAPQGRLNASRACVFIKHTNPCGVGMAPEAEEAYARAYLGDPNAAMGGVLACSFPIEEAFANTVMETYDRWGKPAGAGGFFLEVWVAPSFDAPAIELIQRRKPWGRRVRLMAVPGNAATEAVGGIEMRQIPGGLLVQTPDLLALNEAEWQIVTRRQPSPREMEDLRLAWLVCKHTKSNAITICREGTLLGNGAGQMSRVLSCRIATWLARENRHDERLKGAAAASDAFFPFADGPRILMDAGITAIVQPGGSKRDDETIRACDEHDVALVLTGVRHFRH